MSQEYTFTLPFDDFDLDLIGLESSERGSSTFTEKVSQFFADQFAQFGGKARVIVNDSNRDIEVRWTKGASWQSPKDKVLELLNAGKIAEAVPVIWTLVKEQPQDSDNLYNLGVSYSELGELPKAISILEQLVRIDPDHVHGLVALGVAQIRSNKFQFGEESLRKALKREPRNPWALRNIGACLMKQGRSEDAVPFLELAVKVAPNDLQAIIGLGQALESVGRTEDADDFYARAIKQGGPPQLIDIAKERRTHLAHSTMRERAGFRPDAMMYIAGALEKFANMTTAQIQAIGFEIAILGQSGLDINNPDKKYTIKSLPGEFSGLHLCSIMFAAFKQFAPNEDVGIDFSQEYSAAISMKQGK
ncbi:MAG: tetratricopeptide repeat protein [Pirellulaceae bacterium]